MANSVIGALRVTLGLDSAQFSTGLKQSQSRLATFGKTAGVALAAVATAAAAAGAAIGVAVKGAIDRADDIGKLAQKVGVSVEALSRLQYAANLSDVSLDGLGAGLQKLSQNVVDAASNLKGPAASAFAALGVSVQNADGTLRSSEAIIGDVADRFASMENGAQKTALAVQIFGKSGADLIPLLNAGSAGLAQMADESDRLGLTISTNTAAAAERFNDTLTRVGSVVEGLVMRLAEAFLPTLEHIATAIYDIASDPDNLEGFLNGIVEIFKLVVTAGVVVVETLKAIGNGLNTLMTAANIAQSGFQNWPLAFEVLKNGFTGIGESAAGAVDFVNGLWTAVDKGPKNGWPKWLGGNGAPPKTSGYTPPTFGTGGGGGGITGEANVAKTAIESVNAAAEKLGQTMSTVGQSIGSSLKGLIDGSKDLSDVLLDIVGIVGKSLFQPFGGSDPAGNLLSGLIGGLFGYANGTNSARRGLAWVGERGPELVNFRGGEQVIPNSQIGGPGVTVIQQISLAGAMSPRDVSTIATGIAAAAKEVTVREVKSGFADWQQEYQQTGGVS